MYDESCGLDCLGADDWAVEVGVQTIPTAGANYTDAKTVAAVQSALVKKKYDCGTSGPQRNGVDGVFGPKTKKAIQKMQGDIGQVQSGKIDEGVIMALQVTPGVLPPGVSLQDRAALQAQVALDAATAAEHAVTPSDVQLAAQQAVDAAPPAPPALKQNAQKALAKAREASSPAQVKEAAAMVKTAADDIHSEVKPSWWTSPAWAGGYPRWQVGLVATGALTGLGFLGWAMFGGDQRPSTGGPKYDAWRLRQNKRVHDDITSWRTKRGLSNEWANK